MATFKAIMKRVKIGTRESQLATWQATQVQLLLKRNNVESELVFIKSEGDIDTITPLYELGVQGIFTRALDAALLNKKIDIAVHSMKDVPTRLAKGIRQAAVLKRATYQDILVFKGERATIYHDLGFVNGEWSMVNGQSSMNLGGDIHDSRFTTHDSPFTPPAAPMTIATSSVRRKAQWLHRYPNHTLENLRGNLNTRLRKIDENHWHGAIFAAAGLERIHLRPENSITLDWMVPAPAQGAITIACRAEDDEAFEACHLLNDEPTDVCTKIERDFLRTLLGGCSTPIGALAVIASDKIIFKGNICSPDGQKVISIEKEFSLQDNSEWGVLAGTELLENEEAEQIIYGIQNAKK
jgi:hydroxymethylbilane synthase